MGFLFFLLLNIYLLSAATSTTTQPLLTTWQILKFTFYKAPHQLVTKWATLFFWYFCSLCPQAHTSAKFVTEHISSIDLHVIRKQGLPLLAFISEYFQGVHGTPSTIYRGSLGNFNWSSQTQSLKHETAVAQKYTALHIPCSFATQFGVPYWQTVPLLVKYCHFKWFFFNTSTVLGVLAHLVIMVILWYHTDQQVSSKVFSEFSLS